MRLMWNGIVKNESTRIERCLNTLVGHIDGIIVLDTGSTDNTIELIEAFARKHKLPCEVGRGTFATWDQARNDALTLARKSENYWDYLLLVDADMELVVSDPDWKSELRDGLAYEMVQKAGVVVYNNSRLLSRLAVGIYRGVTHEYLDVPSAGCIRGAYFLDHADGANRDGKALRDAALLRGGLEKEPQNGRYWYYLGQSLRDAGQFAAALPAFESAIKYSTWDEEQWNAMVHAAHCHEDIGDVGKFIQGLLAAYNFRPQRAEALYDLAKYFREKGQNHASLLFTEMGLTKPLPADRLFVNVYPYRVGFKEEFAICGYYDPDRRVRARAFNDELSLSTVGEHNTRLAARNNMFYFVDKLEQLCPSVKMEQIRFTPPDGYVAMNPSLSQVGDLCVRCVNYTIKDDGSYAIRNSSDGSINRENPIHTRNFIRPWQRSNWVEVVWQYYKPLYNLVLGAEDMRLFRWRGELWSISNFRDRNHDGRCEQWLARIEELHGTASLVRKVEPKDFPPAFAEKNWMPWVKGDDLFFVHRLGTVLDQKGNTSFHVPVLSIDAKRLSGGGTLAKLPGDNWLAITHEAQTLPNCDYKRYYYHRFILIRPDGFPIALSRSFVFEDKQIEFAAGLAIIEGQVTISFGKRDCEPWMATIPLAEVERLFK